MVWPTFDTVAREYGQKILWAYLSSPHSPVKPNENFINDTVERALLVLTDFMKKKASN
jgi:hypothetical protein